MLQPPPPSLLMSSKYGDCAISQGLSHSLQAQNSGTDPGRVDPVPSHESPPSPIGSISLPWSHGSNGQSRPIAVLRCTTVPVTGLKGFARGVSRQNRSLLFSRDATFAKQLRHVTARPIRSKHQTLQKCTSSQGLSAETLSSFTSNSCVKSRLAVLTVIRAQSLRAFGPDMACWHKARLFHAY